MQGVWYHTSAPTCHSHCWSDACAGPQIWKQEQGAVEMTEIFLWLSIAFYGAGFISHVLDQNGSRRTLQRVSTYMLTLALILLTLSSAARFLRPLERVVMRR